MDFEQAAIDLVSTALGDAVLATGSSAGQRWIEVEAERVIEALTLLRDMLGFDMLTDLTAVDWLNEGRRERYCITYQLRALGSRTSGIGVDSPAVSSGYEFRVKTWVSEVDPVVDSAIGVWKAAGWAEREVYDMFGITFRGHPDLRRILLPFGYPGHPLRKDYPLTGHGERYDFPKSKGVKR